MNFYTRLGIYGFVAIVINSMFALMIYDAASTPTVPLPSEPDVLKAMTAPDATSLSEFRDKMASGRWIDRPFREMTDLLGPGRQNEYSCDGTKASCGYSAGDPSNTNPIREALTSSRY